LHVTTSIERKACRRLGKRRLDETRGTESTQPVPNLPTESVHTIR